MPSHRKLANPAMPAAIFLELVFMRPSLSPHGAALCALSSKCCVRSALQALLSHYYNEPSSDNDLLLAFPALPTWVNTNAMS
jgi:hypothetical protein